MDGLGRIKWFSQIPKSDLVKHNKQIEKWKSICTEYHGDYVNCNPQLIEALNLLYTDPALQTQQQPKERED